MIPVDQEFTLGDGSGRLGDCLRAAVASSLGLPAADVPHFVEHDDWFGTATSFAHEHGYRLVWDNEATIPVQRDVLDPVIAIGMSPRGVFHAVLVDAQTGALVHDPHPSRAGLSQPPTALMLLVLP